MRSPPVEPAGRRGGQSGAHVSDRPIHAAVAGALVISMSAVLVRAADATPTVAALLRCGLALPLLLPLAFIERRRLGVTIAFGNPGMWIARLAGVAFGLDLICWAYSIAAVGAGLATVLGNVQVVFVAILAWLIYSERPSMYQIVSVAVMMVGVVLITGVIGSHHYGRSPLAGVGFGIATSILYALFLIGMRWSTSRTTIYLPVRSLFEATLGATVIVALLTPFIGHFRGPSWVSFGWLALLAVTSQTAGWLLLSHALPKLSSILTSAILLLQPIGALLLAFLTFGEQPSKFQLLGAILIVGGVVVVALQSDAMSRTHSRGTPPTVPQA